MKKNLGGLGKVCGLSGLLFAFLGFHSNGANAWGLSTDLSNGWIDAQLVKQVIAKREVAYCVDIHDSRFAVGTIQRQVEKALSLWLKPLEALGIRGVAIRAVTCESGSYKLRVEIGPEDKFTTLGSYQLPQDDQGHYFSLVKIDSAFVDDSDEADDKNYRIVDFESFVPSGFSLESVMSTISVTQPMSVQAFAQSRSVDYEAAFWSTYRLLIHELGHSFGLCDTYPSQVQVHCDPKYMSQSQPSSVMYDSNTFYLTDDDVAGISALFKRYLK